MAKVCPKRGTFSERDRQYRAVMRDFIWSLNPQYMITLNFNYDDDGVHATRKYRDQRPLDKWLKNFDAVINSRLIQRRVSKLAADSRISFLAFPEFTKDGYLHFHMLLGLPDKTCFTNSPLSQRQVDYRARRIIKHTLQKFFKGASVKVKAIWSKGAVDYTTKCFHRSSEIDWTYWRKPRPTHDANRLNIGIDSPTGNDYDDTKAFISRVRNANESSSRLPPIAGIAESERKVGRRETVSVDNPTSATVAVDDPRKSHRTWYLNLRGYSYRSVIRTIVATARVWLVNYCRGKMTRVILAIWVAALAVDQALLYERFNPKLVPIFKSRIVRVEDGQQPRGLQLLGDKEFLKLGESDLSALFGGKTFNYEEMLSAQAEAADSYAVKREQEAAIPFFKGRRETFLEEATAHRDYSRYTRSLSPRLIPYLVKARVYFEGTGAFSVTLGENQMTVQHESLGRSTTPAKSIAIVIFAEHEVSNVSVSVGIAQ